MVHVRWLVGSPPPMMMMMAPIYMFLVVVLGVWAMGGTPLALQGGVHI